MGGARGKIQTIRLHMEEREGDLNLSSLWGYGNLMSIQLALRVAIESNIFNIIDNAGPGAQLSTVEISSEFQFSNPNSVAVLDKLLRYLSVKSLLKSSLRVDGPNQNCRTRTYGLTDVTQHMVTNKRGNTDVISLAPSVIFGAEALLFERMNMLKDAILDPENSPFFTSQKTDIFELSLTNPGLNKSFNDLMSFWTRIVMKRVLETYKGFEEVTELMDVGGGMGTTLHQITSVYPHILGINFDLPHVIADTPVYEGIKHVAGDMFHSLPKAETIWIKSTLHDWDDEQCKTILRNCWEALPENGKLLLMEVVASEHDSTDEQPEDLPEIAVMGEFHVMLLNLKGKERTTKEFDSLAKAASFTIANSFHIIDGLHVMEFLKEPRKYYDITI